MVAVHVDQLRGAARVYRPCAALVPHYLTLIYCITTIFLFPCACLFILFVILYQYMPSVYFLMCSVSSEDRSELEYG